MVNKNDGKYHEKNKLNDLTGKDWLKLTKSFWMSEKCSDDKAAFNHPAPFLVKDIEKLISLFTKKGMTVLDPFMGSGTTGLAAKNLERFCYGIDLNEDYYKLAKSRYSENSDDFIKYFVGDSLKIIPQLPTNVDYIVTSPPYHNILKNSANGIRKDTKMKGFRSGPRIGIEYYSNKSNDLGNQNTYEEFLDLFKAILTEGFKKLNNNKYCSIIISDFTVNKFEVCAQSDIVRIMQDIGFEFVGTTILLQDNKPLYPFGYPYAYKINHMHQNIINFRKKVI